MTSDIKILTTLETSFAAARKLDGGPARIDGHNYQLRVTAVNNGPDTIERLQKKVKEVVLSRLDHVMLDELMPETDPASVARWIWKELTANSEEVHEIQLQEKRGQWVTVSGGKTTDS